MNDDLRAARRKYDKVVEDKEKLQNTLASLDLETSSSQHELKTTMKEKESLIVAYDVLRLEAQRLRDTLKGKAEEQADTLDDMLYGMLVALALIYIILAWVFGSYGWPLIVMLTIPLGLTGAIFGHWIMGFDLTILSLFGFFGLAGIIINDSIILISTYKSLRESGMDVKRAIVESSQRRLRAVLLTSMTTIAGLAPLLFETSLQAQFLIPMAISISFGLAFGTVLILLVIPAMLFIYDSINVNQFIKRVTER